MVVININAYKVADEKVSFKDPVFITVQGLGDKFCSLAVEGKEYVVESQQVITAMEAACRG